MNKIILGIDPGINASGVTIFANDKFMSFAIGNSLYIKNALKKKFENVKFVYLNRGNDDFLYFKSISCELIKILLFENLCDFEIYLFIENYSFGSISRSKITKIAEFIGVLKTFLFNNFFIASCEMISVTSIKKFISFGHADKNMLFKCFINSEYVNLVNDFYSDFISFLMSKNLIVSPYSDVLDSLYIVIFALKKLNFFEKIS